MATSINRVTLTGNLTRDPEMRSLPSGLSVCSLRVAVNSRRKNPATGEWQDDPNYFDISVFGAQGENCGRFLSKGRAIAIDGRLDWREWENDDGRRRQAVSVVAEHVQFLGAPVAVGDGPDVPPEHREAGFAATADREQPADIPF